jgi:RNA polymerase sigma factor (sigma-70 family)
MAGTQAAVILRHVRGLSAGLAGEVSDRDLLERYATAGEEAAFEALVRRHGPLVLGVCRRVLGNHADAEDAFQAAFLTLASKAGSIRKRESVGCWLYQVAFHAAVRARTQAVTRKKVERQAGAETPADPLAELTGRELVAVLDDELQSLPERCRVPLVLCYLQGLTCDEAARRAGWPVRTFKRRLDQARALLRARLGRRGLALPVALSAASLAEAAEATVPASLVGATLRATQRGAAAVRPAALVAATGLRFKPIAAALLLGCLVTCGAVALAQQAPPLAGQKVEVPRAPGFPLPVAQKKPDAAPEKGISLAGRVLDVDGKPLPGAEVALVGRWYPSKAHPTHDEVLAQAKTDAEGRFSLARKDLSPGSFYHLDALAGAKGHGLGWTRLVRGISTKDIRLRLEPERVIRGRLIDLQGLPAAGIKGRLVYLAWKERKDDLRGNRLAREQMPGYMAVNAIPAMPGRGVVPFRQPGGFEFELAKAPKGFGFWPRAFSTDDKGRFEIHGLSAGQLAHLLIEDDRFARQELKVDNGDKKPPTDLNLSLAPVQRIEGRVICGDTGKPAVGAHIHLSAFRSNMGKDTLTTTDAEGRFSLNPYPGTSYLMRVWAAATEPYLTVEKRIDWPRGAARQAVEITLPRGVEIKARLNDGRADKTRVNGVLYYVPQRDNETAKANRLLTGRYWLARVLDDGAYRIVVPPGPGHLLVDADDPDVITRTITQDEVATGKPGGPPRFHAAVVPVNLQLKDGSKELEIKLRRGVTLRGKVVDPDGKPVRHGVVICSAELLRPFGGQPSRITIMGGSGPHLLPIKEGRFELRGCDPDKTYRVFMLDIPAGRGGIYWTPAGQRFQVAGDFGMTQARAGIMAEVSAAKAKDGGLTIKLEPCGIAKVRLLDAAGQPSRTVGWLELEVTPDRGKLQGERAVLGPPSPIIAGKTPLTPDKNGVVTLRGLVPGATYRFKTFDFRAQTVVQLGREFTVESGKARKLPDVVAPQVPAAP